MHERVLWKRINLYDDLGTEEFIEEADVIVYLVHSLVSKDFREMDREFADRAGRFAKKLGVKKIVYLGGIIPQTENISEHLRSRKETGEALAKQGVPVVEVRASIVLGACSASYQMIYWLSRRLPVLIMPKWGMTKCSPIALEDAVDMLAALIEREIRGHELFEIGSEVMEYGELLKQNGEVTRGKRNRIIYTMLFPIPFAAWVVSLVTGVSRRIIAVLFGSLKNDSTYTKNRFVEIVGREPKSIDETLKDLAKEMEGQR